MAVHSIQIRAEKSVSLEKAREVVRTWISNHDEVLKTESSELSVFNTKPMRKESGTDYFRGIWRFSSAEDKKQILEEIEKDLNSVVSWYAVDYHLCDHDEETSSGCPDFKPEKTGGDIPEGV